MSKGVLELHMVQAEVQRVWHNEAHKALDSETRNVVPQPVGSISINEYLQAHEDVMRGFSNGQARMGAYLAQFVLAAIHRMR